MSENVLLEVIDKSVDVRGSVADNWAGDGASDESWGGEEGELHGNVWWGGLLEVLEKCSLFLVVEDLTIG